MAVLSDILRRFSVWWPNKREKPLRQAIARTQGSATRRVEQRMFEASLGMVQLPCEPRMRSPEVDRIARRARTELMAGHPVRLYVPLRDRQQKAQDSAMNSPEQFARRSGSEWPVGNIRRRWDRRASPSSSGPQATRPATEVCGSHGGHRRIPGPRPGRWSPRAIS